MYLYHAVVKTVLESRDTRQIPKTTRNMSPLITLLLRKHTEYVATNRTLFEIVPI